MDNLLNKIQCPDKDLQITGNICRSSHSNNFIQASTYLQIEVARIFRIHSLLLEGIGRGDTSKLWVEEKVAVMTTETEEGSEAEEAEVDITKVVEVVEKTVVSQIRKIELTPAIQLVGMNR